MAKVCGLNPGVNKSAAPISCNRATYGCYPTTIGCIPLNLSIKVEIAAGFSTFPKKKERDNIPALSFIN
jgi:hypothetical protein